VIEANPRASRTVPLVSKVAGVQMAGIATHLMLGDTVKSMGLDKRHVVPYYGVKEAVLPFDKFPEVDPVLGPEMRSTGEVLGLADNFGLAYFKSQEAAGAPLPTKPGKVLVSLTEKSADIEAAVKKLVDLGFTILATEGTAAWLRDLGIPAYAVAKIGEGRPDCLDVIKNREVSVVINTPSVKANSMEHLGRIRKACIKYKVPYLTTIAAAYAAAEGIAAAMSGKGDVRSLQSYHASIA
ncbi:MAG: carbamoyl phosphate synthase large subunit, partial [Kiritimatiellae bacterium]|nr:carbamoyl phosphate synthase large subunit [Kiritimatiellia bacterium]